MTAVTVVSRTKVSRARWVRWAQPPQHSHSHCEGNKIPYVAVQSRGTGNIHREANLPPARQPRQSFICLSVCVLCDICSQQEKHLHMQANGFLYFIIISAILYQ